MNHGLHPLRFLTGLCLLATVLLPAHAQDSYVLKRAYKAGEKEKYQTTLTITAKNPQTGEDMKLDLTLSTTETTKEVREDGTIILQTVLDKGTLRYGETEQDAGTGQAFTTTLDKSGKVRQETNAGGTGNINAILALTRVNTLPEQALKIGEPYKFELPIGPDKKVTATGVVTLIGLEKKNEQISVDTMRVKSVVDTPLPSQPAEQKMHIEALAFVEPGTGKALKTEGTITGKMGPLGDAKMTFKRLRVEEKAAR